MEIEEKEEDKLDCNLEEDIKKSKEMQKSQIMEESENEKIA